MQFKFFKQTLQTFLKVSHGSQKMPKKLKRCHAYEASIIKYIRHVRFGSNFYFYFSKFLKSNSQTTSKVS